MDELLQKIMDDLCFARDNLRDAHGKASAVEALLLWDMIGKANDLLVSVERLYNARQLPAE